MRRSIGLCLAVVVASLLASSYSRAAAKPEDTVRSFYATLLDTMKRGPELGSKGRYDMLEPEIRRAFDLSSMARMAVGSAWSTLAPEQQQRLTDAFARYTTATYADRFDSYSGEKFEVTGTQDNAFGKIVLSRIVKSNGEPVSINYLMRNNRDDWQIGDVYLTGTISQVATLRSQFGSVLARQGADGLVNTLNRKADTLVAAE